METHERTATAAEQARSPVGSQTAPPRRVGTFTIGLVFVISGAVMLCTLFFPKLDYTLALKLSPLALVSLGIETLLSVRKSGRIKYDWVGMLLCCLIVCVALALFFVAWCVMYHPDWMEW